MFTNNVDSGAGSLLSEMQHQIEGAGGPTMAFTLIMQKQALEDRIRFKKWLEQSNAFSAEIDQANEKATASVRLSRRAQHAINGM